MLARIIEPTSKADRIRVLDDVGVPDDCTTLWSTFAVSSAGNSLIGQG